MISQANSVAAVKLAEEVAKNSPYKLNLQAMIAKATQDPDVQTFLQEHQLRPDSEVVKRNAAEIFNFVKEKERSSVGGYEPELIFSGSIEMPGVVPSIKLGYRPTKEKLAADRISAASHRFKLVDSDDQIKTACFAKVMKTTGKSVAIQAATSFIANYSNNSHSRGFYLHGNLGTGKTYLVSAMIKELSAAGTNCLFVYVPTFIGKVYQYLNQNTVNQMIDRISQIPVLVLDDIGSEKLSSWNRDQVLGVILESRMESRMPTFFTSNLTFSQLERHLAMTKDGIDFVKAKRLMERVRALASPIKVDGMNQRHRVN